jgi:hypothetical protein
MRDLTTGCSDVMAGRSARSVRDRGDGMAASPAEQLRDVRPPAAEADHWRPRLTSCAASCAIAAGPTAPRQMRRFTATLLAHWGIGGESEFEIREIVSELVTNAVCHSGSSDVSLTLTMCGGTVHLTVRDTGRWKPPRRRDPLGLHGRGLALVSEQATRSGLTRSVGGTQAWAQRDVPEEDLLPGRLQGTPC